MSKSKLDEATELVETAAGAAGKVVEKVEKVVKIAKDAGIGHTKKDTPGKDGQRAPGKAAGTQQGWFARRRAKKAAIRQAAPALVTARAYVARALFYAALVLTGVVLLILYLAKAASGVAIAVPLVVLAFFLCLAIGFRIAFASLRPRLDKSTAKKVAALRVAADATQASPAPMEIPAPAPPVPVPEKAVKALAKLFRHYGGGLRGVPDVELENYAQVVLNGTRFMKTNNNSLAFYSPVLTRLVVILNLQPPTIVQALEALPATGSSHRLSLPIPEQFQVDLIQIFDTTSLKKDTTVFPLFSTAANLYPIQRQLMSLMALCALMRCLGVKTSEQLASIPEVEFVDFKVKIHDPSIIIDAIKKMEDGENPPETRKPLENWIEDWIQTNKTEEINDMKSKKNYQEILTKFGEDAQKWAVLEAIVKEGNIKEQDIFNSKTIELPGSEGSNIDITTDVKEFAIWMFHQKAIYMKGIKTGGNIVKYEWQDFLREFRKTILGKNPITDKIQFSLKSENIDTSFKDWYKPDVRKLENPKIESLLIEEDLEKWLKMYPPPSNNWKGYKRQMQRLVTTIEPNRITEFAAVYFGMVIFIAQIWRANKAKSKDTKLSQLAVTHMDTGEKGSTTEATGFDYSYLALYPELPDSNAVEEYVEFTGTQSTDEIGLRGKINIKVNTFLKDHADEPNKELTVIGLSFAKTPENLEENYALVTRETKDLRVYFENTADSWFTEVGGA